VFSSHRSHRQVKPATPRPLVPGWRQGNAINKVDYILRRLFGIGKPKGLQGEGGLAVIAYLLIPAIDQL